MQATRRLGATTFVPAVSAVDIAVWDLRGIVDDAPLWRVLGGERRDVPFYGSGRSGQLMTTDELVAHSNGGVAEIAGRAADQNDFARLEVRREKAAIRH